MNPGKGPSPRAARPRSTAARGQHTRSQTRKPLGEAPAPRGATTSATRIHSPNQEKTEKGQDAWEARPKTAAAQTPRGRTENRRARGQNRGGARVTEITPVVPRAWGPPHQRVRQKSAPMEGVPGVKDSRDGFGTLPILGEPSGVPGRATEAAGPGTRRRADPEPPRARETRDQNCGAARREVSGRPGTSILKGDRPGRAERGSRSGHRGGRARNRRAEGPWSTRRRRRAGAKAPGSGR